MGDVIRLAERRAARDAPARTRGTRPRASSSSSTCACPFSYLAAERVERVFDDVVWTPASTTALRCGSLASDRGALADDAQSPPSGAPRELRLPLVWPERFPADVPAAMRAASYAAEHGRGAAFVLAAGRLAFCGGFDLDDPEILAEAAAAAGHRHRRLPARRSASVGRDGAIEAAGRAPAGRGRRPAAGAARRALAVLGRGARRRGGRRRAACRPRRRSLALAALRADEPGEDLRRRSPPRAA